MSPAGPRFEEPPEILGGNEWIEDQVLWFEVLAAALEARTRTSHTPCNRTGAPSRQHTVVDPFLYWVHQGEAEWITPLHPGKCRAEGLVGDPPKCDDREGDLVYREHRVKLGRPAPFRVDDPGPRTTIPLEPQEPPDCALDCGVLAYIGLTKGME